MSNVLSIIFCSIVGLEFIVLMFIWILSSLYSLSTDVSAENRRKNQEKRDAEYHKARMKDYMK